MSTITLIDDTILETTLGKLRGATANGIHSFKGIRYGTSTAGPRRFLLPAPPEGWTGIRDALDFGPRAPQPNSTIRPANAWIRDDRPTSEDCLVLNLYTPELKDGGKRPVMVYLHGGGYERGAGSAPGLDGSNLACAGDVVVVTLNHRLNAFGFTHLAGIAPNAFGDACNVGMLDIVAALRWVRDNAEAFGGDPGNVTIFGQSGGGSKVAVCMAMPEAKGLFHKAIMQSSSSHLRLATRENADRAAEHLLHQLGLDISRLDGIQDIPADTLLAAHAAAVKAANGNDSFRPVVDGKIVPHHPFDLNAPDLASDIPLLIGSCETEKSFYDITADPASLPLDDAQLTAEVARFVGIGDDQARTVIAGYRADRPDASGRDLYNVIASDHMYRRNAVEAAERKAKQGGAPAYLYEVTWKTPVLGGMLKSPHTMCLPFVFGTTEIAKNFTGTGPEQEALTRAMMGAWIAFARTGDPNHAGLPDWTPYAADTRPTMIFDNDCRLEHDPKPEDRERINTCPQFVSDMQWPLVT
jgi:para-nitrobenzyl esterase